MQAHKISGRMGTERALMIRRGADNFPDRTFLALCIIGDFWKMSACYYLKVILCLIVAGVQEVSGF